MIARMSYEERSISIKLSPAQIDEVLRAVAENRAPSLTTLIADALGAPISPATGATVAEPGHGDISGNANGDSNGAASRAAPDEDVDPAATAADRLRERMPIGAVDPRLSRALLRGLSILTCFAPDGEPRGILEIAAELGMSPSTTHRYALTLVELGLLQRSPTTRKYSMPS
jgi:IclR helix-turn-helix domain